MAEWLYESGIGEARAALVDGGRILEMAIEPDTSGHRVGAILAARLLRKADATGRARVRLADGGEADCQPPPAGVSEGGAVRVEVVREPLPERGGWKALRVRPVDPDTPLRPGPTLRARIGAGGMAVRTLGAGEDLLEAHGWSELLEEAASGIVARPDALLRISLTPAMTLIDVDGAGPPAALAVAGARRAGEAIRLFGIAGSIGIDLPTVEGKSDRQAAAAALDAILPQPFERTAVNGFGFLQIVRRRVRASLPEQLAAAPVEAAARALLRRAERAGGHGAVTLAAPPAVIAVLQARSGWLETLAIRTGATARLREEPGLPIWASHAQRDHV